MNKMITQAMWCRFRNFLKLEGILDRLRGTKMPPHETLEGWKSWKQQAMLAHPFRYWFVESLIPKVARTTLLPLAALSSFKYYLYNRFVAKTHTLTSRSLQKGIYHELDTRILHCLFDELVNFVECELSWIHLLTNSSARTKFAKGFLSKLFSRRNPAAGLAYLAWASNLTYNEDYGVDKNDLDYGKTTKQAIDAQEILELYQWWTQRYPSRVDPHNAATGDRESGDWIEEVVRLEQQYLEEDEIMMIRLIKVRSGLWT